MDFQTITTNLAGDVTAMQATSPFSDGVVQPIVDALDNVSSTVLVPPDWSSRLILVNTSL